MANDTGNDTKMLGWTMKQGAHAVVYVARVKQFYPAATLQGAIDVKRWWTERRYVEPGEVVIEGVRPEFDYEWAVTMFLDACSEVRCHG